MSCIDEVILLKNLLMTGEGFKNVPKDFFKGNNRNSLIYKAMLSMRLVGLPIDIVSVSDYILAVSHFNPLYEDITRSDINWYIEVGEQLEMEQKLEK